MNWLWAFGGAVLVLAILVTVYGMGKRDGWHEGWQDAKDDGHDGESEEA